VAAPRLPTPRDALYHLCHCHIDQGSIYRTQLQRRLRRIRRMGSNRQLSQKSSRLQGQRGGRTDGSQPQQTRQCALCARSVHRCALRAPVCTTGISLMIEQPNTNVQS
jgi:hypothetical protein